MVAPTSDGSQGFIEDVDQAVLEEDEAADEHSFGPLEKSCYPVDGLAQLVGVVVAPGRRAQVGGAEAAQQQRQEQVQNLEAGEREYL